MEEWAEMEHVGKLGGEARRERRNQMQQPGGPKAQSGRVTKMYGLYREEPLVEGQPSP